MTLTQNEIEALFALPFNDLIYKAQSVHRQNFDVNVIQLSALLSIKTGGCSEDCSYCAQSTRHATGIENENLLPLDEVIAAAQVAKAKGATRFCMGAAWRGPKDKDLQQVLKMVHAVHDLGLETCATLGMLKDGQAEKLAEAGLDYYNHNLDTAKSYYNKVVHTHGYKDRLDTINKIRAAGIKICCGGIIGMGESRAQRISLITELNRLSPQPESVPINLLVRIAGTPLGDTSALDPLEFIRTIAVARIAMPKSYVRLSAGREQMPDHLQAMCFLAGANSIFYGDKLLTTANADTDKDMRLFKKLGLKTEVSVHAHLLRDVAEA